VFFYYEGFAAAQLTLVFPGEFEGESAVA